MNSRKPEAYFMKKGRSIISLKLWSLLLTIISPLLLFAQQDWRLRLNDDWYNEIGSKGLRPGDTMPDIPLGKVLNNTTGKTRFSEFKGKLVILDFWSTTCTSCIAAFPEMEKLQQEFRDKIQVLLVNSLETEEDIKKAAPRLAKFGINNFKLPDLPCIVAQRDFRYDEIFDTISKTNLYRLFPVRGVPHHVWISSNSIIKLSGSNINTYASKIRDFLAGKEIPSVSFVNTLPIMNQSPLAYYQLLGNFKKTPIVYGSYFTPYNDEVNGWTTRDVRLNVIDSGAKAIRNSFVNCTILDLYQSGVFDDVLRHSGQIKQTLYSGKTAYAFIDFGGIDTCAISLGDHYNDETVRKTEYCYEQIVPLNVSESEQRIKRLEDFNAFFRGHIGVTGAIETRRTPCYVLVRTSKLDKLSPKDGTPRLRSEVAIKGKKMYRWSNMELNGIIGNTISLSPELNSLFLQNKLDGKPWILLNETGWDQYHKKMDIILPKPNEIKTINDLRKALQPYDLDIIEAERDLQFGVLSKVSKNTVNQ